MRALTAPEMVELWERGLPLTPLQRSLLLVSAAAGEGVDSAAQLSVGERDRRLLTLREWAFGSDVAAVVRCPRCDERLEFQFRIPDVRVAAGAEAPAPWTLDAAGYRLRFRAPNSKDLLSIASCPDPAAARLRLLERCVFDITHDGAPATAGELPDEVIDLIAARIAETDPQADVQIAMKCPQCGHDWHASFDIGPFFWSEIHMWAQRLLGQVHVLASAYGWREMDILMMSPRRREFYLNCIDR